MERRLSSLGGTWRDTTAVQLYTVHDIHSFLAEEIVRRGAARNGLTWHFDRPPVVDIEYEMDCRAVHIERVVLSRLGDLALSSCPRSAQPRRMPTGIRP